MYKIAIITIGDEICIGQIVNTNAAWIASKCTETGADVILHSSIKDNPDNLISELTRIIPKIDLLIITGGLGPTHDDITKTVLTEYFNDELILDKETEGFLENVFKGRGFNLSERNREQALVPSQAKVLENKVGTAPGLILEQDGKKIVALPGVPAEMKYIMTNSVLPIIKREIEQKNIEIKVYKVFNVVGITESNLADLIGNPKEFIAECDLAFLPTYRGIRLRIGAKGSKEETNREIDRVEQVIKKKISRFIVGDDNQDLLTTVTELLKQKNQTVAVAESCTGGLLGAELTSISGSSDYFLGGSIVYSNGIKEKILNVTHKSLLDFGAVSKEVASQLAEKVMRKFDADFGIAITGIAGPSGGTKEKPVGTVWISVSDSESTDSKKYVFSNDRKVNRERSVGMALTMLLNKIKSKK